MTRTVAKKDADGVHRYEFGTLAEAVAFARSDVATSETNRQMLVEGLRDHGFDADGCGRGDTWTNHYDYERLAAASANPPAHLLKAIDAMRRELVEAVLPPPTRRRQMRRGQEYGDTMDLDRYAGRDPMMWDRMDRVHTAKRTVTVGVNLAASHRQRPEELLWRGAAALALADCLTAQGVNVCIVLFQSVGHPSTTATRGVVRYVAKDGQMPLDIGAVAFATCEIAWMRLVTAYGAARLWPGKVSRGLGHPEPLPEADKRNVEFVVEQDVTTREAATAWLRGCMEQGKGDGRW